MDEITIGDKVYVSSKRAAKITGYAKDYVGQLCREGRVEARLVGRNWYVLESSIREHRFGESEQASASKAEELPVSPVSEWNAPRYQAVTADHMPELSPKAPRIEDIQELAAKETALQSVETVELDSEKVVEDMQEAWREWFTRQEKGIMERSEDVEEEVSDEYVEGRVEEFTPEEFFVAKNDVYEPEEDQEQDQEQEEVVPIHRTRPVHQPDPFTRERSYSAIVDLTGRRETAQEVPVVRPTRREERPQIDREEVEEVERGGSGIILKAVLLSIAALAMVTAFIGSGYADSLLNHQAKSGVQQGVIDYLQGASSVNK